MTPGVEFSSWTAQVTDVLQHMVLPVTAMTLMLLGQYFLIMRCSMVDVMTEDFITVKRAIGLSRDRVINRHAVPNALLPLVTLSAIQFGAVVGGAITIETVFSWPGLGELTFTAINDKDFPVLAGCLPRLQRRRDLRQPRRGLPLLLPRPPGEGAMSGATVIGVVDAPPGAVDTDISLRRRLFGTWRGRFAVGVIALFVFLAVFGPLIAPYDPDASSLDMLASPSWATRSAPPSRAPTSSVSSSSGPGSRSSSASPRR